MLQHYIIFETANSQIIYAADNCFFPPDCNSFVICCISIVEWWWNIIKFKNEALFNYIQSKIDINVATFWFKKKKVLNLKHLPLKI